jgi:hypothetical protein
MKDKRLKEFLKTEEAMKVKAMEKTMGLQLNGLMITLFTTYCLSNPQPTKEVKE